jgi:hypothetical protein
MTSIRIECVSVTVDGVCKGYALTHPHKAKGEKKA